MKNAIKKAMEGGYKPNKGAPRGQRLYYGLPSHIAWQAYICLDPLFWQSLGKACGWEELTKTVEMGNQYTWLFHWLQFIFHLAKGKDADSFFITLLPTQTK